MLGELEVLEKTSHPNVMAIYELLHDKKFYFIVSEYLPYGELYDYRVERAASPIGPMTESEVRAVTKQIFYALNYLHS